jgi:hypothetical protein
VDLHSVGGHAALEFAIRVAKALALAPTRQSTPSVVLAVTTTI